MGTFHQRPSQVDVDLPRTGERTPASRFVVLLLFAAVLGVGVVAPREAWRARPVQWSVRVAAMVGTLLAIVGLASGRA